MNSNSSIEEVLRKLLKGTLKSINNRFHAQERLREHHTWTLWLVIAYSLSLALMALLSQLGYLDVINENIFNLILIIASLVIAVLSANWGAVDFTKKELLHHKCQLEIQEIKNEIELALAEPSRQTSSVYIDLNRRYFSILACYDNHKDIDYRKTQLHSANSDQKDVKRRKYQRARCWEFSIYYALISILVFSWLAVGFAIL